ncbi:UNVERIFIED_CONTAM: hypothetical protein HHA_226930 [Hammondia hammondi]|eukprot:XP_008882066.1 hypothetical protein HHA_226930 [Hammondia hammondi]
MGGKWREMRRNIKREEGKRESVSEKRRKRVGEKRQQLEVQGDCGSSPESRGRRMSHPRNSRLTQTPKIERTGVEGEFQAPISRISNSASREKTPGASMSESQRSRKVAETSRGSQRSREAAGTVSFSLGARVSALALGLSVEGNRAEEGSEVNGEIAFFVPRRRAQRQSAQNKQKRRTQRSLFSARPGTPLRVRVWYVRRASSLVWDASLRKGSGLPRAGGAWRGVASTATSSPFLSLLYKTPQRC